MIFLMFLIPALTMMSALLMYRFTGRHEVMKFDLVQFSYAFIISPVMFVWLKSFLFFLLRSELNLKLSVTDVFVVDTIFTLIFMYIFAFVVIHTLTKTFDLYRYRDPLYDIFEHTEFFHQEASHFVIHIGVMCILSFVSFVNVFVPTSVVMEQTSFYFAVLLGGVIGLGGMISIWMYESQNPWFHKFMKLAFGTFFLLHTLFYFLLSPEFSYRYLGYWFVFAVFFVATFLSLFAEKSKHPRRFSFLRFYLNWRKPSRYLTGLSKVIYKRVKLKKSL